MKRLALAVAVASILSAAPAQAQDAGVPGPDAGLQVELLLNSGPSSNRIDITVMGDGYRVQDQAQLTNDANTLINALMQLEPYKTYKELFNVKLIHVVSNQNGADDGSYGATRDTALGCYFGCAVIDRLLCCDQGAIYQTIATYAPENDISIVLSNDPKYGGSGGDVVIVSLSGSASQVVGHEFGHTIANLADEYTDAYPGYPPCPSSSDCWEPNATLRNVRKDVKWNLWIDAATPVPTPSYSGYSGIGDFEGCRYLTTGVYRPKDTDCLMRALGYPYCSVCAEAVTLAYWNRLSMIDASSPASPVAATCAPVTLSVTTPPLQQHPWKFTWTVDSNPQSATGPSLVLDPAALGKGAHTATVVVADMTPLIRNDKSGVAHDTQTWTINVPDCGDAGTTLSPDASVASPDAASPGLDAAAPGLDAANPGLDAAAPGVDAANPGLDAANPGLDAANPGPDAAAPGLDAAAAPGLDAAATLIDAAMPVVDAGGSGTDAAAANRDAATSADASTHPSAAAAADASSTSVDSGCGCTSSGHPPASGMLLLALALLGVRRRVTSS